MSMASIAANVATPTTDTDLDLLSVNTIRTLSIDAVQQAKSGHPGTPMALAPLVYTLWNRVMRFDPQDPIWPNRDRFVLSNGHASMLNAKTDLAARSDQDHFGIVAGGVSEHIGAAPNPRRGRILNAVQRRQGLTRQRQGGRLVSQLDDIAVRLHDLVGV